MVDKKQVLFLFQIIFTLLLITACSGGNSSKIYNDVYLEESINYISETIPERNETQNTIKNKIYSDIDVENAPLRSPISGDYYFSLSKEKIEVLGSNGTAEIQFIYIENYMSSTDEVQYKGKISYIYENQTINNIYSWILTDTIVSFGEIETGSITASVNFFDEPLQNISVFGKSGEEYTRIGTTDINGQCTISDVLVNMYDIYFVSENFPEKIVKNINVISETESTLEVSLLPYETNENASVFGHVYFDIYKTEPAADVLVTAYCENTDTIYKPSVTDSNGYFIINSLPDGTYEISAVIEKNEKNIICHINEENFGSAVKVDDIIMYNNSPVVTLVSHNPSEEINIEYNGKLKFIVEAYDSDNNQLTYDWTSSGGNLKINNNICDFESTDHGKINLKLNIRDNMGGNTELLWTINSGWVNINSEYAQKFPGRYGYASVVFRDKIFVIGGINGYRRNDVIYSEDGSNWTTVANMPWSEREEHAAVVFNDGTGDKIWIFGGKNQANEILSDAWYSEDGLNWTMATDEVTFGARYYNSILNVNNKLYSIAGIDSTGTPIADIWESTDGIHWNKLADNLAFGARAWFEAVYFKNKFWVIGGYLNRYWKNDVWSSSDGIIWNIERNPAEFPYRSDFAMATDGNTIILGGGNPNYQSNFWISTDGIIWTEIPNSPFSGRGFFEILNFNGTYHFVGGYKAYDYAGFKEVWKLNTGK